MSLPCGGYREDAIHKKMFGECIRDKVDSWFTWSRNAELPVDRMEDLILVTGCTLVTSYASVVLDDHIADGQVSLVSRPLNNGGASFVWGSIRGTIEYHDSQLDPVCLSVLLHCLKPFDISYLLTKEYSIRTAESMCLHQGLPSQASHFLDQADSSCSRTPS